DRRVQHVQPLRLRPREPSRRRRGLARPPRPRLPQAREHPGSPPLLRGLLLPRGPLLAAARSPRMNVELDVVLVRGAPGAGKRTLGRRLRKALTAAAVVEVDDLRAMIAQVDWTSRRHHDQALEGAFALVGGLLGAGLRPIVLIDTLSRS